MDALDPESGGTVHQPQPGIDGRPSIIKQVVGGILERVRGILYLILPGGREVGRENKFYFDEETQRWCLPEGAISAEEEAQVQAAVQQSTNGLRPGDLPSWGNISGHIGAVPPPPTGTAVTSSRNPYAGGQAPGYDPLASVAHPVYAPSASINYSGESVGGRLAPPPMRPPRPAQGAASRQPLASPFGANLGGGAVASSSQTPLTSPFGSAPMGAQQAPLSSAFAQQAPLSSPFGQQAALAAPSGLGDGLVANAQDTEASASYATAPKASCPPLGPPTIAEPLGSSPDAAVQQRAPPSPIMAPTFAAEGALANPFGGGSPSHHSTPVGPAAFASLPELALSPEAQRQGDCTGFATQPAA